METFTKEQAIELLEKYNKEEFHIQHGKTVGGVMRYFADCLGYGSGGEKAVNKEIGDLDYWELVGLLHDIDFEMWPDDHCKKAPELLAELGASEDFIHAVVSHGCGECVDIGPELEMEKVLFATDELTGLIGAAALMRPSKSVSDMEVKSVKKKFKDKKFAAGCDRQVIRKGAEMLGWELDKLMEDTLAAMKSLA
ncbi:MAG: hydrolase [Anaerovoracaceae bacterium]